jgi:hypothetical protein
MADTNVNVVPAGADLQVRQQVIVLAVLLIIYASIPVAACIFDLAQMFGSLPVPGDPPRIDEHWFVSFLGTLSGSQKSILELIHKLVLPLAALFVGANLQRLKSGWLANSLFIVPLVGVIASLASALLTLFTDMASNLGVFTLLMVGVNVGGGQKQ